MNTSPQYRSDGVISIDEAVNRIGIGKFQHKVLIATGTCFMADSMEVMLLAFLSRVLLDQWGDHGFKLIASISSCLFAGALIGSLFWGPMGDRFGRKPVLVCSGAIISLFVSQM